MAIEAPTLLAVAHGTVNPNGLAEIRRLLNIVRTKRPELSVELCWLERAEPLFADLLATISGPVVVVPVLLSTGYHVKVDIGAIVAERPQTAIAEQLGPDQRITAVVFDRLMAGRGPDELDVVLLSAGSTDPDAAQQLRQVADDLQQTIRQAEGSRMTVYPCSLSGEGDRGTELPDVAEVANYLLAPGRFNDMLQAYASDWLASDYAAPPIGAHPKVADVICDRYDEAARTLAVRLS